MINVRHKTIEELEAEAIQAESNRKLAERRQLLLDKIKHEKDLERRAKRTFLDKLMGR